MSGAGATICNQHGTIKEPLPGVARYPSGKAFSQLKGVGRLQRSDATTPMLIFARPWPDQLCGSGKDQLRRHYLFANRLVKR
jgi:hypothetical protein